MSRPTILLIAVVVVGCGTHQPTPPPKIVTIGSLTDATRRLELLGYRHDEDSHILGQHWVNYKRETPDATIKASIVRWEDDQRIKDVHFHVTTNYPVFDSDKRLKVMSRIEDDVCALINGREDYLRSQRDAQKIEGSGLARYQGRATTVEGWQIDYTEYIGYYAKAKDEKGHKITLAQVALTHVATNEDMTPAAVIEFNRALNQGKKSGE